MSKLHAQMGLYAAIDAVAGRATNPETVRMIDTFLPGTTGIGQQGWSHELERFLNKEELHPLGDDGKPRRPEIPVAFPQYSSAIDELRTQGVEGEDDASPAVKARTLFASTILNQAWFLEGGSLPLPDRSPGEGIAEPLDDLLPAIVEPESSGPARWNDERLETNNDVKSALLRTQTRAEYEALTRTLVDAGKLTAAVGNQQPACTGSLRKLNGKFCTLLTTNWHPPYSIDVIENVIDPHNWPDLCDFFVGIDDQTKLNPDRSRGWTRVLETVSSDETQWRLLTALRYWKGTTNSGRGLYVNYDLDDPRKNDCDLVEVDAGYVWVLPNDDPKNPVTLRTCKQVRIRGLSPTATAALGCFMGWGDAMSQMFDDDITNSKVKRHKFPPPSVDPGAFVDPSSGQSAKDPTTSDILRAAEDVELLDGWRALMIGNVAKELTAWLEVASGLTTDFRSKWMDGMTVDDVQALGARFGKDTTKFATDMFKGAAGALQPSAPDLADSAEGKV